MTELKEDAHLGFRLTIDALHLLRQKHERIDEHKARELERATRLVEEGQEVAESVLGPLRTRY